MFLSLYFKTRSDKNSKIPPPKKCKTTHWFPPPLKKSYPWFPPSCVEKLDNRFSNALPSSFFQKIFYNRETKTRRFVKYSECLSNLQTIIYNSNS